MVDLLKTFGKGVLYVLGLPFFILILLLFAIAGVFIFLFQVVRSIIFFFTGQKFFPELEEDKQLRLMREGASQEQPINNEEPLQQETNSTFENIQDEPIEQTVEDRPVYSSVEDACFRDEEVTTREDLDNAFNDMFSSNEEIQEEEPVMEEHVVETTMEEKKKEEAPQEILDVYTPKSSDYDFEGDDDDFDNGVNINFDD